MMQVALPPPPLPPPPPPPPLSTKSKRSKAKRRESEGTQGRDAMRNIDPDTIDVTQYVSPSHGGRYQFTSIDDLVDSDEVEEQMKRYQIPSPTWNLQRENQSYKPPEHVLASPNSEVISENSMPATPVRRNTSSNFYHRTTTPSPRIDTHLSVVTSTSSSNPVLALLVGNPPPPPPPPSTPPNNKTPQKRRSKTPTHLLSEQKSAMVWDRDDERRSKSASHTHYERNEHYLPYDGNNTITITASADSTSLSTITHSTIHRQGNESMMQEESAISDSILEERFYELRTRTDRTNDPPTGISQTGRSSLAATPRMQSQQNETNSRRHTPRQTYQVYPIDLSHQRTGSFHDVESPSPMQVISVKSPTKVTNDFRRQSLSSDSKLSVSLDRERNCDPTQEDEDWNDENDNSVQANQQPTAAPERSTQKVPEIQLTKTSVATIEPSVDMNKDSDRFHSHSSPSLRQGTPKKYRVKTPERLRRINGNGTKSQTPVSRNNRKPVVTTTPKSFHSNDASEQQAASPKKGFFRKLFSNKRKGKQDKTKTKNTTESSVASVEQRFSNKQQVLSTVHHPVPERKLDMQPLRTENTVSSDSGNENDALNYEKLDDKSKCDSLLPHENGTPAHQSYQHDNAFSQDDTLSSLPSTDQDHHDLYLVHDEVSTLSIPTVDSFHVFGFGADHNKLHANGSQSFHTAFSTSQKNSHDGAYPRRRREDPSIQSLSVSDPLGDYWEKGTRGTEEKEGATSIGDNRTVSTQASDPFDSSFFDGQSLGQSREEKEASARMTDGHTKLHMAASNVHDPLGQSPFHTRTALRIEIPMLNDSNSFRKLTAHVPPDPTPHLLAQSPSVDPIGESPFHNLMSGKVNVHLESTAPPDPLLHLDAMDDSIDGSTTDEELVQSDNDFSKEEKKDDHDAYRPVSAAHGSKKHGKSSRLSSPHPFKAPVTSSRSLSPVEHEQQIRSVGSETPRAQNTSKDKQIFFGDDVCMPSLSKVDIPVDEVRPDNVNIEIEQPSATQKNAFRGNFKSYKNFKETKTLRRNKAEPDDLIENSGPIDSDEVMESMKAEIDQKASPAVLSNQKHLKVSSAARNNARTLAYIHSLTGGPSPRSLWKQSVDSEDESSTHNEIYGTSPSTGSTRILRHRKIKMRKRLSPSSSESSTPRRKSIESRLSTSYNPRRTHRDELVLENCTSSSAVTEIDAGRLFSAYNPKFKGRKPVVESRRVSVCSPRIQTDFLFVTGVPKHLQLLSPRLLLVDNIRVTSTAFQKGVRILRENREYTIAEGLDQRVSPSKRTAHPIPLVPVTRKDVEPKDPIQRAGRRLLSKAAVPIQAAARQFLAQREAVDRMWGLLEIQSYMRRWKAEAAFLAYRRSVVQMQKVYRGYRLRKAIAMRKSAAVTIQKIIRGYLISVMTYELVYRIIVVQTQVRGFVARLKFRRERARQLAIVEKEASTKLQTWWRWRSISIQYRYLLIDTILAQTIIRQWFARRRIGDVQRERQRKAAIVVQKSWRCFYLYSEHIVQVYRIIVCQRTARSWMACRHVAAVRTERQQLAAIVIQKSWRSFQAYSDYIMSMVKVLICQKTIRGLLARNEVGHRRADLAARKRQRSALVIQTKFRQYSAFKSLIVMLVHILIIQRNARIWAAKREVACVRSTVAATKIQCHIRCFLMRRQYVQFLRIERAATILQKQWRCHSAQTLILHRLVHIIIVQSVARCFLAKLATNKMLQNHLMSNKLTTESAAATKIQTIWRRFWSFSHYVILQYETVRIQSLIRGKIARTQFSLQLGCCILIQAVVRMHLSRERARLLKYYQTILSGQSTGRLETQAAKLIQGSWRYLLRMELLRYEASLVIQATFRRYMYLQKQRQQVSDFARIEAFREGLSAKRIQFWWRVVMECRRERKAALVIERFFLMIKAEIEREIQRVEKRKSTRSKHRREERKKRSEESLLERVWVNTVDGNIEAYKISPSPRGTQSGAASPSEFSFKSTRSAKSNTSSNSRKEKKSVTHRASSPSMNLVMRHDFDNSAPAHSIHLEEVSSTISGLTFQTNMMRTSHKIKDHKTMTTRAETTSSKNAPQLQNVIKDSKPSSTDKYLKMYGIKTGSSQAARVNRFFADDLESLASTEIGSQQKTPDNRSRPQSSSQKATDILRNLKQMEMDSTRQSNQVGTNQALEPIESVSSSTVTTKTSTLKPKTPLTKGAPNSSSYVMSVTRKRVDRKSFESAVSKSDTLGQLYSLKIAKPERSSVVHLRQNADIPGDSPCSMQYSASESASETHSAWGTLQYESSSKVSYGILTSPMADTMRSQSALSPLQSTTTADEYRSRSAQSTSRRSGSPVFAFEQAIRKPEISNRKQEVLAGSAYNKGRAVFSPNAPTTVSSSPSASIVSTNINSKLNESPRHRNISVMQSYYRKSMQYSTIQATKNNVVEDDDEFIGDEYGMI